MIATWVVERLKLKWRNKGFLNIYGGSASKVNGIVNVSSKRNVEMNVYRSETINPLYSKKVKE